MSFGFFLQKTWVPLSTRPTTITGAAITGPTNITLPFGREVVTVSGTGQPGNNPSPASTPGNPASTPGTPASTPGNPASTPGNPGTNPPYSQFVISGITVCGTQPFSYANPGCGAYYSIYAGGFCSIYAGYTYWSETGSCSTTPGNPYTNPTFNYTNPTFNYTNPTFNYTNPTFNYTNPGNPGTAANVLGVAFPGGAAGSAAPYVPSTVVSSYTYPDNSPQYLAIQPGSSITVQVS